MVRGEVSRRKEVVRESHTATDTLPYTSSLLPSLSDFQFKRCNVTLTTSANGNPFKTLPKEPPPKDRNNMNNPRQPMGARTNGGPPPRPGAPGMPPAPIAGAPIRMGGNGGGGGMMGRPQVPFGPGGMMNPAMGGMMMGGMPGMGGFMGGGGGGGMGGNMGRGGMMRGGYGGRGGMGRGGGMMPGMGGGGHFVSPGSG